MDKKKKITGNIVNFKWFGSGILTAREALLYSDIINWNLRNNNIALQKSKYYTLSNAAIANKTGFSIDTVKNSLKQLEDLHLIQRTGSNQTRQITACDFDTKQSIL